MPTAPTPVDGLGTQLSYPTGTRGHLGHCLQWRLREGTPPKILPARLPSPDGTPGRLLGPQSKGEGGAGARLQGPCQPPGEERLFGGTPSCPRPQNERSFVPFFVQENF